MNKKIFLTLVLFAVFVGCIGPEAQPDISVSYPKVMHSKMTENAISVFMFIENKGDADDFLISARIKELPDKKVEIHDVVDGKMVHIEKIKIPASEVVELKMGSYHVMAFDITEHVDDITVVLNFGKSGEVEVAMKVPRKEDTAMESMEGMAMEEGGMDGMEMGGM